MRRASYYLRPDGEYFGRLEETFAADPDVSRRAIHYANLLEDGTAVFLFELDGDADRASAIFDGAPGVYTSDISSVGDRLFAYVHAQPNEVVRDLLRIVRENEVVLEYPMRVLADGGIAVTALGDRDSVRSVVDDLPSSVGFTVREFGEYRPSEERIASRLTDRQTEVLATAVAMGYYENPRRATCADLAEELGCAAGTAAEHLRVIESKVLPEVAAGGGL
jgi:SAM-dependent methyltransferase